MQWAERRSLPGVQLSSELGKVWENVAGFFPWIVSGADLQCCVSCLANGQLAQTLQQAYLPTVDYATCSSPSYWGSTVKNTMVCAGGDGARSGCQVNTCRKCLKSHPRSLPSLPTTSHLFLTRYSTLTPHVQIQLSTLVSEWEWFFASNSMLTGSQSWKKS